MVTLVYKKPMITQSSILKIDGLKVGAYRFQLRVIDESGNVSKEDIVTVQVSATRFLELASSPGRRIRFMP